MSERGAKFAEWFRTLLPQTVRLAPGWQAKWAKCYDALVTLDGRTPEQIAAVCRWARAHDFWQQNFLTPLKLRKTDRDGANYFDKFLAGMNPRAAARAVKATREHGLGGVGPQVERM